MKHLIFILLSFITLFFMNCDDTDSTTSIWYQYNETQCADAWQTGIGSPIADVETAVENYFSNLNIDIEEITVDTSGTPEVCLACMCLSGRLINIKVDDSHEAAVLAEGFFIP